MDPNSHPNSRSYYQMDPQVTGDQLSSHPSHDLHNAAYPESDYQPGMGHSPPPPGASSSHANRVGQDSKPYPPAASNGEATAPASDVINNAAYPESNYRPGAANPSTGAPRPSHSRPLPCPKHLESAAPLSESPWMRSGPSSSAAGPSCALSPQATGSEPPPPPYQPGGSDSSTPQPQPPSASPSRGDEPSAGCQASNASPSPAVHTQQQEMIPMTTFPVYQNAIGHVAIRHVAIRSNASTTLERGYKEYDRDQARVDEKNRRNNRRKWLIGTLSTTVAIAAMIGVIVALLKFKVFGDDNDDD